MYYAFIILWLFSYSLILFYVIHANCVLCVVPWVGGVDVYTMCAVHRLSALVSWERLVLSCHMYWPTLQWSQTVRDGAHGLV